MRGHPGRPPCTVDGCDRPNYGHGLCMKHWTRWRATGNALTVRPPGRVRRAYNHPPTENITPLDTPCREWQGGRVGVGYGSFSRQGRRQMVHRWVWEQVNGPIPDGMIVMHLCDNPPCFRYDHLVLGTLKANTADREAKQRNNTERGRDGKFRSTK